MFLLILLTSLAQADNLEAKIPDEKLNEYYVCFGNTYDILAERAKNRRGHIDPKRSKAIVEAARNGCLKDAGVKE